MNVSAVIKSLQRELAAKANQLSQLKERGSRPWTAAVKDAVCHVGHLQSTATTQISVCAAGCQNADEGEWLFDLCWSSGRRDSDEFNALPLVMESEWCVERSEILRDFGKLLIAKSAIKLFVFQQSSRLALEAVVSNLRSHVDVFECGCVPSETYLIAGLDYGSGAFHFWTWPSSGSLAN